ncbi:MAG: hypothetical protein KBC36_00320 [Spirochaetia bacterium]|nr:hypothetical protein [Spirochaetia bacterium]
MVKSIVALAVALVLATAVPAQTITFGMGDPKLDASLNELNVSAKLDLPRFWGEVSLTWGVPAKQVAALAAEFQPAEIYLAAGLAKLSKKPLDTVLAQYRKAKAKGWGALARSLGIKPGSKGFKDLMAKVETSKGKLKGKK